MSLFKNAMQYVVAPVASGVAASYFFDMSMAEGARQAFLASSAGTIISRILSTGSYDDRIKMLEPLSKRPYLAALGCATIGLACNIIGGAGLEKLTGYGLRTGFVAATGALEGAIAGIYSHRKARRAIYSLEGHPEEGYHDLDVGELIDNIDRVELQRKERLVESDDKFLMNATTIMLSIQR